VAEYKVNRRAVANIKRLIDAGLYVVESNWDEAQPSARDENAYLEKHTWPEYAGWHLGLTEGAGEGTKARCAFVVGDFERVHRSGIIAAHFRAAQYFHKEVELAAHRLLQYLDEKISGA
jgi:hypothetical protein